MDMVLAQPLRRAQNRTCRGLTLGMLGLALLSCESNEGPPSYARATGSKETDLSSNSDSGSAPDSGSDSDAGATEVDPCVTPGHAGCPCETAGATADCGRIDYVSGDYVTCVMGTSRCDGTQWGPCTGNRIVAP